MADTTRTSAQIRVRLQHSSTIKEGWRLSETTVEYISGEDYVIDWEKIEAELVNAAIVGNRQATERNAES